MRLSTQISKRKNPQTSHAHEERSPRANRKAREQFARLTPLGKPSPSCRSEDRGLPFPTLLDGTTQAMNSSSSSMMSLLKIRNHPVAEEGDRRAMAWMLVIF